MGHGALNEAPWLGTVALYVAEVALVAPANAGMATWSARFAETDLALPHADTSAAFTFLAALPPDHELTISVADTHTHAPIEQVEIRCGCYRASTNGQGLAILQLPAGTYEVSAWKLGYDDATPTTIDVNTDLGIRLETSPTPETNPDSERAWM
jgi:hypothetical protein